MHTETAVSAGALHGFGTLSITWALGLMALGLESLRRVRLKLSEASGFRSYRREFKFLLIAALAS